MQTCSVTSHREENLVKRQTEYGNLKCDSFIFYIKYILDLCCALGIPIHNQHEVTCFANPAEIEADKNRSSLFGFMVSFVMTVA